MQGAGARNAALARERHELARQLAERQGEVDAARELMGARLTAVQRRARRMAPDKPREVLRLHDENEALQTQIAALQQRLELANRDANAAKAQR